MGFLRIERVFVLEKTCALHQGRNARFRMVLGKKMTPPLPFKFPTKHFTFNVTRKRKPDCDWSRNSKETHRKLLFDQSKWQHCL